MLTHIGLFSGIGGFTLAAQRAGIPTIAEAEIDKAAAGVLRDHWPHHIYDDIRSITGDSLTALGADPGHTVLTAGWPCQGNSVAGRRGGMDDARSGLWSEVARILDEFRPAWFVGENVPGLLSVAGGWDYATVVGDLARLGYGFAWRVLDAQHFGVPQRRRRVVLVGRLGNDGRAPAQVLLEPEGGGWNPAQGITPRPLFAPRTGSGAHFRSVSPAVTAKWAKGTGGPAGDEDQNLVLSITGTTTHALTAEGHDASEDGAESAAGGHLVAYQKVRRSGERGPDGELPPEVWAERDVAATLSPADLTSEHRAVELVAGTTVRRLTPLECERLQGYPDGWTLTSNGKPQSDSQRYKQIGNSIAVPVFEWTMRRLAAVDEWQRRGLAT